MSHPAGGYRHLIVTGGRGYIGRAVVEAALVMGYRVTVLSRDRRGLAASVRHVAWRLGEALPPEALDPILPLDVQGLVHLAHDWSDVGSDTNINLVGARILRDSGRQAGLGRLIFVSSQSARSDALNAYGRVKWRIEQLFDGVSEISVRVGLVYGGPRTAQYGLLCRIIMATSVMPMVMPHQPVQPIHRNEVARGIVLAVGSRAAGAIGLAAPRPIPFSQFLDTLAWRLRSGRMLLIPVPLKFMLRLCAIANALPFALHFDRERILGLAGTRPMATAADLKQIGLEVVPFAEAMLDEPAARRALLAEARAILRYVLRCAPGGALMRRYARAAAVIGPGGTMRLNRIFLWAPWLLRFVEPFRGQSEFMRRFKVATALAEASPEGWLALRRGGRVMRLAGLSSDAVLEVLAAPVRLFVTALRR
ncbi:MAG: NAD(P)-dependent oxidoreductase [Methylovirgula sp.]